MLDERLFRIGSFITDRMHLYEVKRILTTGRFPVKHRIVNAENCYTGIETPLTEKQLAKFEFVQRSTHA